MANLNCWEFMHCQRGPGGSDVAKFGLCPAATAVECDGFLGGINGGRACAFIAGTLCGGEVQGEFAQKRDTCFRCEFFVSLVQTHGSACSVVEYLDQVRR